jgi:YebC/PmpR family DNA-binding regulatory protein
MPSAARFSRALSKKSRWLPALEAVIPTAIPGLERSSTKPKASTCLPTTSSGRIQKEQGELPGQSYEDATYEGFGPSGVAVVVEAVTDNKNRTVSEIRHVFGKARWQHGQTGSVAHLFSKKGLIVVEKSKVSEDTLMAVALDAGAEDMQGEGDAFEVYTAPKDFDGVVSALKSNQIEPLSAELAMIPMTTVKLEGKAAQQMIRLMEALEEHEDVQKVFANFDIDEAEMEAAAS